MQVDSVAASLTAVGKWLRDGAKLAVLGVLGLGLVPLLVGAFMELAVVPLRCASMSSGGAPDYAGSTLYCSHPPEPAPKTQHRVTASHAINTMAKQRLLELRQSATVSH